MKFILHGTNMLEDSKNVYFSSLTMVDNFTFRGMRKNILDQFSDVYLLDLNGSGMRKVSGDKNVFDIRQGVSVFLFSGS